MAVNEQTPSPLSSDEETLHQLGYAQELRRRMSGFSNFAVSFTIISILSGCLTLYGFGMNSGGPAVIVWGWPFVGVMTLFVGLAMAEVCSSYPDGGRPLLLGREAGHGTRPAWSWFTGWFNFLGQVAVTAGIDFGAARSSARSLTCSGASRRRRRTCSRLRDMLALHGVLNQFGVPLVALAERRQRVVAPARRADHRRGAGLRAVAPPVVQLRVRAPVNNTGFSGPLYVFLLGLLLAQYTFTGYDASAHMTEETQTRRAAARAAS